MSGAELIAVERANQLNKWSPDHDDMHDACELSIAAAVLALHGGDHEVWDFSDPSQAARIIDQWGLVQKHKDDEIRKLVIAGALIAAEIDRLKRMGGL